MSVSDIARFSVDTMNNILLGIVSDIVRRTRHEPERYLKKQQILLDSGGVKDALAIDVLQEASFREYAKREFPYVEIFGEEDPRAKESLDLSDLDAICALVDMVDGTDLVERGLSNWCSSAVFFHPKLDEGRRIIGAFIGVPSFEVYYADGQRRMPRVVRGAPRQERKDEEVAGRSDVRTLNDSSICFYGQKGKNLRGTLQIQGPRLLDALARKDSEARVYDLAGMPMMVKLFDKRVDNVRAIDAVFDICGQQPHDVVPGVYLAMRAGCSVRNLETGQDMEYEDLERALMRPFHEKSKLRYIVASTPELAAEIESLLDLKTGACDDI